MQRVAEAQRTENVLSEQIIGACVEVHRAIGPGLLESAYEQCLCHELALRQIPFRRQVQLPLVYKGIALACSYRLDVLVDERVIVEIKSVDALTPLDTAQLLTYLKLTNLELGLLINFNVPLLKHGVRRVIHQKNSSAPL